MAVTVKLSDIIEGMEMQTDEMRSFLNKENGTVYSITYEELRAAEDEEPLEKFPQWQRESIELAVEILETDNYIALPSKFDIHEYNIMEEFCLSLEDEELSDLLYNSIKGSGAFRRFKDNIHRHGIAEEWYKFREEAFKKIAIEWCADNDIRYTDFKVISSK